MLQQAISTAGIARVDLVGYGGAELPRPVSEHPGITVHRLPAEAPLEPERGRRLWWDAALRLTRQTWRLGRLLLRGVPRPDILLVQNPPALPTLAVAWVVARLRRARWVIDWHNLGFSLLELKLGAGNPATRLARRCEILLGRRADAHLCVSAAMREALESRWGVKSARVLYDRPTADFAPQSRAAAQQLLDRLLADLDLPASGGARRPGVASTTGWCDGPGGPRRPAVLVSPTSWTLDEDFPLLLDALDEYERELLRERERGASLPDLVVLLTGRGPLRAAFEASLGDARWTAIRMRCTWLDPETYARLLGSADLGLCLHRSSSKLDLPMKIADMLGAGLPVCALDYGPVLAERFRDGDDGLLFADAGALARTLIELLRGFPSADSRLDRLRGSLRERPVERWAAGWEREARPLFAELSSRGWPAS